MLCHGDVECNAREFKHFESVVYASNAHDARVAVKEAASIWAGRWQRCTDGCFISAAASSDMDGETNTAIVRHKLKTLIESGAETGTGS
jgi:hypothetical protein